MSTRLVSGGPHSACQADGRCKSADTKAACLQFLYGMVLEWKELPCKSADSAHRSRTLGTVVAHAVFKRGAVFWARPDRAERPSFYSDDRTSVDGHTSPGPKRPVRYIASLRETGEWVLAESAKQRV